MCCVPAEVHPGKGPLSWHALLTRLRGQLLPFSPSNPQGTARSLAGSRHPGKAGRGQAAAAGGERPPSQHDIPAGAACGSSWGSGRCGRRPASSGRGGGATQLGCVLTSLPSTPASDSIVSCYELSCQALYVLPSATLCCPSDDASTACRHAGDCNLSAVPCSLGGRLSAIQQRSQARAWYRGIGQSWSEGAVTDDATDTRRGWPPALRRRQPSLLLRRHPGLLLRPLQLRLELHQLQNGATCRYRGCAEAGRPCF